MVTAEIIDDLPLPVKTAQRRVARAIAELPPPAGFSVLVECLAAEMVAHGIVPCSALFEGFVRMQVGVLIQRVAGICQENGIEIVEEPAPEPVPHAWWRKLLRRA